MLALERNNAFNDKASITADPNDGRFVYAVWTRYEFPVEQAKPRAEERFAAFRGPVWLARSTDAGRTWEPAGTIYDPGEQNHAFANQIVVLPDSERFDGELINAFDLDYTHKNAHGVRGHHVAVIRSADHGRSWSSETLIAAAQAARVIDPLTGAPVRPGLFYPDIAVDSTSGTLYAVWHDTRFSNGRYDDTALSMSTDGGSTWTAPVKVNQTPSVPQLGDRQAFTPSVHVAADGSVGVDYYDFRNDGSDADASEPLETDRFLARCGQPSASALDLCPGGWTETRLTAQSFDVRTAPNASGLFLGDYVGWRAPERPFSPSLPTSERRCGSGDGLLRIRAVKGRGSRGRGGQ